MEQGRESRRAGKGDRGEDTVKGAGGGGGAGTGAKEGGRAR